MNGIEIGKRRSHFLSEVFATVVYCLGLCKLHAREPVPGYQRKMVLFSQLEYPLRCSYSISPWHTPFWNVSVAESTKQWINPEPNKNVRCAHRDSVPLLCPIEYKVSTSYSYLYCARIMAACRHGRVYISAQWVPYSSTVPGQCEHCLKVDFHRRVNFTCVRS